MMPRTTSQARVSIEMSKRRPYQYSELPQEDGPIAGGDDVSPKPGDEDFIDSQYTVPKPKVPYKAIGLAMFLCVCGTISLILGILIASGFIHEKYLDRMWPLFILGSLMSVPGYYHVRIAYLSFMKRPGYNYDQIPEF